MPYFGAMSIHKSQQFWCVQLMCQWNPHFFLAKAANFMLGQSPFPLRTQLCFEWGARSSTEAHWVAMVGTTNHLEDNYYECTFIGWFGGFGSLLYFLEKMCYMRNSCQSFHYSDQNIHLLYIYTYILYIYIYICTHTHTHTHTYIYTHTHTHTHIHCTCINLQYDTSWHIEAAWFDHYPGFLTASWWRWCFCPVGLRPSDCTCSLEGWLYGLQEPWICPIHLDVRGWWWVDDAFNYDLMIMIFVWGG